MAPREAPEPVCGPRGREDARDHPVTGRRRRMSLHRSLLAATAAVALAGFAVSAEAQTKIEWWHAMGGELGEKVAQIAADFNATQSDYQVDAIYKGNYTETMTAAIAAFRAGQQ